MGSFGRLCREWVVHEVVKLSTFINRLLTGAMEFLIFPYTNPADNSVNKCRYWSLDDDFDISFQDKFDRKYLETKNACHLNFITF